MREEGRQDDKNVVAEKMAVVPSDRCGEPASGYLLPMVGALLLEQKMGASSLRLGPTLAPVGSGQCCAPV
jgi:hypothetical protein